MGDGRHVGKVEGRRHVERVAGWPPCWEGRGTALLPAHRPGHPVSGEWGGGTERAKGRSFLNIWDRPASPIHRSPLRISRGSIPSRLIPAKLRRRWTPRGTFTSRKKCLPQPPATPYARFPPGRCQLNGGLTGTAGGWSFATDPASSSAGNGVPPGRCGPKNQALAREFILARQ